jgi:hypothetical protein
MAGAATESRLHDHLFADREARVLAILDGASVPNLPKVLWKMKPERVCLVKGELTDDEASVAPYLVALDPRAAFTTWVLGSGWGRHWGIFAIAPKGIDLRAARDHFRRFLEVRLPNGTIANFRWYDPRVIAVYLPTCNEKELDFVFGPIECFVAEDAESGTALDFRRGDGEVRIDRIDLGEV